MTIEERAEYLVMNFCMDESSQQKAAILRALKLVIAEEREACAEIALNWGYSWNYNTKYQPWADELNHKLRVQNKAIADKIRARGGEVKG